MSKPDSDVRASTFRHLRKLLAGGGAAAGAALALTAGNACDPAPEPLVCSDGLNSNELMDYLFFRVTWLDNGSGFDLVGEVHSITNDGEADLPIVGTPQVVGATVIEMVFEDEDWNFTLVPDTGATEVVFTVTVDCDGDELDIEIVVDVSEPPVDEDHPPHSMHQL